MQKFREIELRKRERKEHLKKQYEALLQQYGCIDSAEVKDKKRKTYVADYRGLEVFKLLARKEEEFDSATTGDYNSRNE